MKKQTIIVFLFLIVSLVLLSSCAKGNSDPKKPNEKDEEKEVNEGSHTLAVHLNLTNPEEKDDSYFIYFVLPGFKEVEPGEATQDGVWEPYETDSDGNVVIDIEGDYQFRSYLEQKANTQPGTLELYVTTKEDIYIRNPLNEKVVVDFELLVEDGSDYSYDCLFKQSELTLDITDKYPDGVVSLTFPDAVFVVKLEFPEPTSKSAYEVSLYYPSDTSSDGLSMIRTGRVAREFQYWDTQFYANELKGKRAVVITDFETDVRINYDGFPLWLEFNDDGTCKDGDIITIQMPPGS